ncbi:hypothetical protein [Georgenia sp. SUBG003]|uniref:hypothetical protein n=1 Tax=Georgenia sp. SUBG003 TaxID=1497974 RepID=UPI003AB4D818
MTGVPCSAATGAPCSADLLREQGATRVQVWTVQADESRTRFLSQAGFAPAGLRRSLDVGGEEVVEICWYAEL